MSATSSLSLQLLPGYHDLDLYSDGASEERLLKLFRETPLEAIASHVHALLSGQPAWEDRVHLSPQRHHLLDWFPFDPAAQLLEIGAGCGALTELFAERVAFVDALEPSTRRATILAHRHKRCTNVHVLVGDLAALSRQAKQYDYITMIGVLEYAGMLYSPAAQEHEAHHEAWHAMLAQSRELLRTGGTLLLALENQLGIKYLAGYAEDHYGEPLIGIEDYLANRGIRTFAQPELKTLIQRHRFAVQHWYYPFPDYKLPTSIYSDDIPLGSLEHPAMMFPTIDYAHASQQYFAESRFARMLYRNNLTGLFANSFLVVCQAV